VSEEEKCSKADVTVLTFSLRSLKRRVPVSFLRPRHLRIIWPCLTRVEDAGPYSTRSRSVYRHYHVALRTQIPNCSRLRRLIADNSRVRVPCMYLSHVNQLRYAGSASANPGKRCSYVLSLLCGYGVICYGALGGPGRISKINCRKLLGPYGPSGLPPPSRLQRQVQLVVMLIVASYNACHM
jgi:hypothetical protein